MKDYLRFYEEYHYGTNYKPRFSLFLSFIIYNTTLRYAKVCKKGIQCLNVNFISKNCYTVVIRFDVDNLRVNY